MSEDNAKKKENVWRTIAQWSAIVFFLAAGTSFLGYAYWSEDDDNGYWGWLGGSDRIWSVSEVPPDSEAPVEAMDISSIRAIDGRPLPESGTSGIHYAVMIDNHPDARPLSGLASASLVYEAPVEGGITRFLAIYSADDAVKRIGPVRSARPYYLDWVAEFDCLYAHVGGSPEALGLIENGPTRDLNEFWNGKYFWRDLSRQSPHKIFTSSGLLGNAFSDKFVEEEVTYIEPWRFKEDLQIDNRPEEAEDVVIGWSTSSHEVIWKYDRKENSYRRFQAGREQRDEDNSPVRAKNLIIQFSTVKVIDNVGRRKISTVGEGMAVILNDGQVIEAVWSKPSASVRTRYLTPDGDEIPFNVGNTWVEIVPEEIEVTGIGDAQTD